MVLHPRHSYVPRSEQRPLRASPILSCLRQGSTPFAPILAVSSPGTRSITTMSPGVCVLRNCTVSCTHHILFIQTLKPEIELTQADAHLCLLPICDCCLPWPGTYGLHVTHFAGALEARQSENKFICDCHGSQYDKNGKVEKCRSPTLLSAPAFAF
jgi:hypothetical protein